MQPHAPAGLPACRPLVRRQSALTLGGGGQGIGGTREDHEEAVALGDHLDPSVVGPRCPQQALVVGEHVGVARAQALEQAGGAPDVGEEEGDGPRGQLGHGRASPPQTSATLPPCYHIPATGGRGPIPAGGAIVRWPGRRTAERTAARPLPRASWRARYRWWCKELDCGGVKRLIVCEPRRWCNETEPPTRWRRRTSGSAQALRGRAR